MLIRPNIDTAAPASISRCSAGLILPIASASGTVDVASAGPRIPCATIWIAMYSSVTTSMASISARGMVRAGSRTSPLAASEVSMPVNANSARISARPRLVVLSSTVCWKFSPRMAAAPTTTKIASGNSFNKVAALTRRIPRATPPRFTQAMPVMTTTMTSTCTGALSDPGNRCTATSASAAATPPQARMLPNQASTPATQPASGPKAAAT